MNTPPDIDHAIEQLDATLHPKTTTNEQPIELTEDMRIASPSIDQEDRKQLIASVERTLHQQLPQLIAEAVDQALAAAADNHQQ